jgi:hypothetical protein
MAKTITPSLLTILRFSRLRYIEGSRSTPEKDHFGHEPSKKDDRYRGKDEPKPEVVFLFSGGVWRCHIFKVRSKD